MRRRTRLLEAQTLGREATTALGRLRVPLHLAEHVGQAIYITKARLGDGFETLSLPRRSGS